MNTCQQHPSKTIEFVCLDKLCKSPTCFACFACIRGIHQNCSDDTLLEKDEFMQLEISYLNKQKLSTEIMNRTNIDLRRALSAIRHAFLKKKDFLLDFMSLTNKDLLENFPRVHALYKDFLILHHTQEQVGLETQEKVFVSSKFKFMEDSQREKELEQNIIHDFTEFMKLLMDMKDCYLEPLIPKEAQFYEFRTEKIEVSEVEGKPNVLEFYSRNENSGGNEALMLSSFGESKEMMQNSTLKDKDKEIVIKSKEELLEDQTWKYII